MTTQGDVPVEWGMHNLPSDIKVLVDPTDDPRHISNVVRYALLSRYGGLWLDHDVIPLERFPRPSDPYTAGMGKRHVTCVMWFPEPRHPLLAELIMEATRRRVGPAPTRSGGRLFNTLVQRYEGFGLDPSFIPHDRDGTATGVTNPKAVHLWEGSFRASRQDRA